MIPDFLPARSIIGTPQQWSGDEKYVGDALAEDDHGEGKSWEKEILGTFLAYEKNLVAIGRGKWLVDNRLRNVIPSLKYQRRNTKNPPPPDGSDGWFQVSWPVSPCRQIRTGR
ncbi:MAG: hypothetical protein ABW153_19750, partial [Sedimenticola sp.]